MKYRLVFFLVTLFACSISLTTSAIAATNITKNQIKLVSDFTLDHKANAGGTITKNYYVFPDTKGSHGFPGTIKVIDRNTCQITDSVYIDSNGYLSGLYNKWGTDYITLINSGDWAGCYVLNGGKLKKSSGCPTPPGRTLVYQTTGQGNTATFNSHTFKVAGYNGGMIGVWNSTGTRVATYIIPESVLDYEPENISVDGSTGEIYINYANSAGGAMHSLWYKIDSSVFSKYTGKNGTSNPTKCKDSAASSGGGTTPSVEVEPYDDSNIAVRDETAKPEIPESTYDGSVDTNFFGAIQDDGKGCGTFMVLNFIIDTLTFGIALAAIIGVAFSGITYLRSKDNEQQATKAKRRIYEIVIGLVAYSVLYAILNFLLPGGKFNNDITCAEASSTSTAVTRARPTISRTKSRVRARINNGKTIQNSTNSQKLLEAAEETAKIFQRKGITYLDSDGSQPESFSWDSLYENGTSHCSSYAVLSAKKAGLLPKDDKINFYSADFGTIYFRNDATKNAVKKKFKIIHGNDTVKNLVKKGLLVAGDIVGSGQYSHHTLIFAGKKDGKYHFYEVYGPDGKKLKPSNISTVRSSSYKIGDILHAK